MDENMKEEIARIDEEIAAGEAALRELQAERAKLLDDDINARKDLPLVQRIEQRIAAANLFVGPTKGKA